MAGLLIERHEMMKSLLYMMSSVILGVGSYFLAIYITRLAIAPNYHH